MVVFVLEIGDFVLVVEVEHVEGIEDEALLDGQVEGRVGGEAGTVIDLQQQRLEVLPDEDVEA